MQNFATALKAENIKKKGTGIYLLAVILGALSPLIGIIAVLYDQKPKDGVLAYNYFTKYMEGSLEPFAGFFFPLLIIITVSRFAQMDHRNGGWQLMEIQPITKFSIYFSKFTLILITNLIAILSLVVGSFLFGYIASFFIDVPKEASFGFDFGFVATSILRLFLGGLMLSAFQYLIAVLLPSFIWSIVIGFFGLLLNIFLLAFKIVPAWSPFEILRKIAAYPQGSDLGYWATYSEVLSAIGAFLLLYIGYKWYMHKNLRRAFFSKPMRFVKLAAVLVVSIALMAWILQPNKMLNYSETVVSGSIEGKNLPRTLYITDDFVHDTIAVVPVTNGKFNYTIKQDIPFARYELLFDSGMKQSAFFGTKDSVYIDLKIAKNETKAEVTGTRLAENKYQGEAGNSWSTVGYYLEDNMFIDTPDYFIEQLADEWREAVSESDKFRTVDNYVPKDDFLQKNKMLITIQYLNYWNTFLKKRAAMFPGEKNVETADIKEMKKTVPLNDEALLTQSAYFDYLKSTLIASNKEDIDENTKSIQAIAKLPSGGFKDKMLYWQLNKNLNEASTSQERDKLLATYGNEFSNRKFARLISNYNRLLANLDKGNPAPLFNATTIDNKPFNLAELKGKYVAIDVWATWCGPCRVQSPYFEKFAVKYKDQPIHFIALSTDQRIDNWYVEAKAKPKSVLQLHAANADRFIKEYNIESIPRFILIDPQGNFVNSEMPFPSDKVFEKLLREALGLAEEK